MLLMLETTREGSLDSNDSLSIPSNSTKEISLF